jgi:hypothetical protein
MLSQLSFKDRRSKKRFTKLDMNPSTALQDQKLGNETLDNCWKDSQKIKQFGLNSGNKSPPLGSRDGLPMLKKVSTAGKVSLFSYQ